MKKYYYVSLRFYGHKVFKCGGFGAEDPKHLAFYKPYFEKYGLDGERDKRAESDGSYKVIILDNPSPSGFIDENGNSLTWEDVLKMRK